MGSRNRYLVVVGPLSLLAAEIAPDVVAEVGAALAARVPIAI